MSNLIKFDASPNQISKLRNGHRVRIKKGTGFNLIVHPENYNLITRAFSKSKGVNVKLSPEELKENKETSPEQHEEYGSESDEDEMEGQGIFKKVKKALRSKAAKKIGRELKPLSRATKQVGKDYAHQKIAEAHMNNTSDDPRHQALLNMSADYAHSKVQNPKQEYKTGRGLRKCGSGSHSRASTHGVRMPINGLGVRNKIHELTGYGLGAGFDGHHAMKVANMASARANHQLATMHNAAVHGQQTQPLLRGDYDEMYSPPSRGTGIHNLIRGRGSMIAQDSFQPPALQSQPFGANFHFQFMLPPEYNKYNSGGTMEGSGLYV